jgi:transcription antitermination factor NusG
MAPLAAAQPLVHPEPEPGAQWFAVWTHSQSEEKVEQALLRKNLEALLPRVRVPSRRRDRRLVLVRPLFPGYLFLRFVPSRDSYLRAANTDGIVRILGDRWDALHPIPDQHVEAVRRIVTDANGARPFPWIRLGDRVRVAAGPLAGLEGFVLAARPGRATFVVSIDLLRRSVGIEVPDEFLARL